MHWIDIQGLGEHWSEANVRAAVVGPLNVKIEPKNITCLRLDFAAGQWPGRPRGKVTIEIDATKIAGPMIASDQSLRCELSLVDGNWQLVSDNDRPTIGQQQNCENVRDCKGRSMMRLTDRLCS